MWARAFPGEYSGAQARELQHLASPPHPGASCTLLHDFLWLRLPLRLLLGVERICGCSRKHPFKALKVMVEHWLLPLSRSPSLLSRSWPALLDAWKRGSKRMETESVTLVRQVSGPG